MRCASWIGGLRGADGRGILWATPFDRRDAYVRHVQALRGDRSLHLHQLLPQGRGHGGPAPGRAVPRGIPDLVRRGDPVDLGMAGSHRRTSGRLFRLSGVPFGSVEGIPELPGGTVFRPGGGEAHPLRLSGRRGALRRTEDASRALSVREAVQDRRYGRVRGTSGTGRGVRALQGAGVGEDRPDPVEAGRAGHPDDREERGSVRMV